MNPMIEALLAIDREAQQTVADANAQREALRLQIRQEKQALQQRYQAEYAADCAARKAQIESEHKQLCDQLDELDALRCKQLNQTFDAHHAEWAAQIAQACLHS